MDGKSGDDLGQMHVMRGGVSARSRLSPYGARSKEVISMARDIEAAVCTIRESPLSSAIQF